MAFRDNSNVIYVGPHRTKDVRPIGYAKNFSRIMAEVFADEPSPAPAAAHGERDAASGMTPKPLSNGSNGPQ